MFQEEITAMKLMSAVRSTITTLMPSMPRKYSMCSRPNQLTLRTSIQENFSRNCIPDSVLIPPRLRSNRMNRNAPRTT